jgi:alpha-amylase
LQETIGSKSEPAGLKPGDYAKNGLVQEFVATWDLKRMFTSGGIGYMTNWGESWNYDASKDVNVFVANHDTERNGDSLTPKSANNAYKLANILLLGWNYGFPTVYSGYSWTNKDTGAPQNAQGYTDAVTCGSNGWTCDHRSNEFKNMALFRQKAAGKKITNTVVGNNQQLGRRYSL